MKSIYVLVISIFLSSCAVAKDIQEPKAEPRLKLAEEVLSVPLVKVIAAVTKNTGKVFFVHSTARSEIVANGINMKSINYPEFLAVLNSNYLASVEIESIVHIFPEREARDFPLPVATESNNNFDDHEWVTKVVSSGKLPAEESIRYLRPFLSQASCFTASRLDDSFIITTTYGNIKKMEKLLVELQNVKKP
jgi:hypothetical protein